MSEERIWLLVVSLCIVGAGLAAAFGGVGLWRRGARQRRTWTRGRGVIVDIRERWRDGSRVYSAIIEFQDHHGVSHTVLDPAEGSGRPREGRKVTVLYDPSSPEDAEVYTVFRAFVIPVLVAGFGLALTAAGVAIILRNPR